MSEHLHQPYGLSPSTLRELFLQTDAYKRYVEQPSTAENWRSRLALKRAILAELFGNPPPRPSNLAIGWRFRRDCDVVLRQILTSRGSTSPETTQPPTVWQRICTAIGW